MDANIELLNFIFQNSEMGTNTLAELIEICEDKPFKQVLVKQQEGYTSINTEAKNLIESEEKEPKGVSTFDQIKTYIMIKASTLNDRSPSHFAEMMIQGSTMGTVALCKQLNSYKDVKTEIRTLAKRLLDFEEKNIEELKKYLRQE